MSAAVSESSSQAPKQEALDKALDQAPVLGIPRMIGVANLWATLSDARKRVQDSHALQMQKLAEVTGGAVPESAEDDMGSFSVQGDTTVTNHITQLPAPVKAVIPPVVKYVAAMLTGAGLPLLGWALNYWIDQKTKPQEPPAVVAPAEDTDTYVPYTGGIE